MWRRFIVLLAVVSTGSVLYFWQNPQVVTDIKSRVTNALADEPKILYRWTDANGQINYGVRIPQGVHAIRVDATRGSVNVLPATKPASLPVPAEAASDLRPIGARALDRAIDQSTQ
jgi:hypothetical protein